jgi:hypothetical protein
MSADDEIKTNELRIWHEILEDKNLSLSAPEYYIGTLKTHAEVLERLGVITPHECRELIEHADAAYGHAVEFGPVADDVEEEEI